MCCKYSLLCNAIERAWYSMTGTLIHVVQPDCKYLACQKVKVNIQKMWQWQMWTPTRAIDLWPTRGSSCTLYRNTHWWPRCTQIRWQKVESFSSFEKCKPRNDKRLAQFYSVCACSFHQLISIMQCAYGEWYQPLQRDTGFELARGRKDFAGMKLIVWGACGNHFVVTYILGHKSLQFCLHVANQKEVSVRTQMGAFVGVTSPTHNLCLLPNPGNWNSSTVAYFTPL